MLVSAQDLTLVLSLASEPADFMQKYLHLNFGQQSCKLAGFNSRFRFFRWFSAKFELIKNPSDPQTSHHININLTTTKDSFYILFLDVSKSSKITKKKSGSCTSTNAMCVR